MEWPSQRVPKGGIFHQAKVNYTPETRKFLKELIQESRLTNDLRNKLKYSLRSGAPLPSLVSEQNTQRSSNYEPVQTSGLTYKPGFNKRRQYAAIVESGAYERERYVPIKRGVDREFAKRYLQDCMAFGKELENKPKPVEKSKKKELSETNRFDEIKQEIQERVEWLKEMEALGEGEKYRVIIEQQIAARVREMERLKPMKNTGNVAPTTDPK